MPGFSQPDAENEWRAATTASVEVAARDAGITLRYENAGGRQEKQIAALRSFIEQGVDVIAFSPVVENGWESVLREIRAANIPVILTDRAVEVVDDTLYVTFIGSDYVEQGRRAGRTAPKRVVTRESVLTREMAARELPHRRY